MKVTISTIEEFDRQARRLAKKYKSLKADLMILQKEIMDNPFIGSDLGSGIRKIRLAIASKGKGKSGGVRVLTLTVLVSKNAEVTLLTIYDKNEIENVSDEYISWLIDEAKK